MITIYLYMNINEVMSFLLLIRLYLHPAPSNKIRIYPPNQMSMFPPFRPSFLSTKVYNCQGKVQNYMHHFFSAPQQLNTLCVAIATTKDEGLPPLP